MRDRIMDPPLNSPCMGCPDNTSGVCKRFDTELEVISDEYVPCEDCDDDCLRDDENGCPTEF